MANIIQYQVTPKGLIIRFDDGTQDFCSWLYVVNLIKGDK